MIRGNFFLYLLCTLVGKSSGFVQMATHDSYSKLREAKYVKDKRADRSNTHKVIFAVRQRNMEVVKEMLLQVSDPSSEQYGKYLSRDEIGNLTSNKEATLEVLKHLKHIGAKVVSTSIHGEYISAEAPIGVWEATFDTIFHSFNHTQSGQSVLRAEQYSLPNKLVEHVSAVFHTVQFPLMTKRLKKLDRIEVTTKRVMTPTILQKYYNIENDINVPESTQSLFEALDQTFSPNDLSTFQSHYELPTNPMTDCYGTTPQDYVCRSNPDNCGEGDLDVEYIMAIAPHCPTYFW